MPRNDPDRAKEREYMRVYRAANRDKIRAYQKKYAESPKGREPLRRKVRLHRQSNPALYRAYDRRKRGLPEPTRPEPLLCEACGGMEEGRPLNLDHCHTTNTFRGWLCGPCNRGLGQFKDSIERLEKALAYLRTAEKIKGAS